GARPGGGRRRPTTPTTTGGTGAPARVTPRPSPARPAGAAHLDGTRLVGRLAGMGIEGRSREAVGRSVVHGNEDLAPTDGRGDHRPGGHRTSGRADEHRGARTHRPGGGVFRRDLDVGAG